MSAFLGGLRDDYDLDKNVQRQLFWRYSLSPRWWSKWQTLSEPKSNTKQTPDVGAVRQSGQSDNNNPSSEMMTNWTRSGPLPLHQIFTPLLVKGQNWGDCHSYPLWFGRDVIIFLGCCHAQSEEWKSCCDKLWTIKQGQFITTYYAVLLPIISVITLW